MIADDDAAVLMLAVLLFYFNDESSSIFFLADHSCAKLLRDKLVLPDAMLLSMELLQLHKHIHFNK
jgi:hypothetical protein